MHEVTWNIANLLRSRSIVLRNALIQYWIADEIALRWF